MEVKSLYKWDLKGEDTTMGIQKLEEYKFSIVIPTLNQVDTFEDTLQSIIRQNYKNVEIIVMDGGSTDGTVDLVKEYSKHIAYFESGRDGGQSYAINKGFQRATGDIFAWINSDDFYLPGAFTEVARRFRVDENIDVIVGCGEIVTKGCQFLKHIPAMEMLRKNLLEWRDGRWIMQQCCFWKAHIWRESGGVDESLVLLMDYDLWLRYAEIGRSCTTSYILAVMRYYPEAKTVMQKRRVNEEIAYVYAKNKAYDELKDHVRGLVESREELAARLEREEKKLTHRLLRKIGLRGT